MRISLLTDAPKYNLALMKLSAWHKAQGDEIMLNNQLMPADKTYASILFEWNKDKFVADVYGGPQYPNVMLDKEVERMRPDYELYNLDHSLGYTFRPCYRHCPFCLVKTIKQPDKKHHSIWEFHDKKFKKICLMNNNTFFDPMWKHTFEEVWAADLKMMEHGMDLRLLDHEKMEAIKKTKFDGRLHFAWDRIKDEKYIVTGLNLLKEFKVEARIYVLIGFETTLEQDLHRCQIIINLKGVPYCMPYTDNPLVLQFKNFINMPAHWWHERNDIRVAWGLYMKGEKTQDATIVGDTYSLFGEEDSDGKD